MKIRGVPQERCDITRNWFPNHGKPSRAVRAGAKTHVFENAYRASDVGVAEVK